MTTTPVRPDAPEVKPCPWPSCERQAPIPMLWPRGEFPWAVVCMEDNDSSTHYVGGPRATTATEAIELWNAQQNSNGREVEEPKED